MQSPQNENGSPGSEPNPNETESATADNLGQPNIVVKYNLRESEVLAPGREAGEAGAVTDESDKSDVLPAGRRLISVAQAKPNPEDMVKGQPAPIIGNYSAKWCVDYIRSNPGAKARTQLLRSLLAQGKTEQAGNCKDNLPGAMVSGIFNSRGNKELSQHSGLICADLDHLGEHLPEIREKLKSDRHVFALFVSPSGTGLKAWISVPADPEKHGGSFRAIEKHVRELTGVEIDEKCKNVERLCFMPYDPDIFCNENAIEIEPLPEPEKKEKVAESNTADMPLRERIATELLGELEWDADKECHFCDCPGEDLHTAKDGRKDCAVYLAETEKYPMPTVHCMHNSCKEVVAEKNKELRSRIGKAEYALACPQNDLESALRFTHTFGSNLRYVKTWQAWFQWDKTRWERDTDGAVMRMAQTLPSILLREASKIDSEDDGLRGRIARAALRLGEAARLRSMIDLSGAQAGIAARPEMFDADPWLLCVRNGVVDLRSGAFRASQKEDYITKQAGASFDKDARCPMWSEHLRAVFAGNESLISFFQCAVGYSLTGDTREHKLFFLHGSGSNGKSTTMETVQALLGNYAQKAPASLFTFDKYKREPEGEIARLMGARLVVGSEVEEGSKLAESRVKDLTGGDTLTGRFLYSHPFDFEPTHKVWIFGNHKPDVANNDYAIWRRICLIPFTVEFSKSKRDGRLKQKLRGELPGILNWAVEGCARWQKNGLEMPEVVTVATEGYRDQEDELGEFIRERCDVGPFRESKRMLHDEYRYWASGHGTMVPLKWKVFNKRMASRRGIGDEKDGLMYWTGIQLKPQESTQEDREKLENVVEFAKESLLQQGAKSAP